MAVDSLFLIIHFSNTLIDEDLCDLFSLLLLFASSSLSSLLKKVDFVVIGCVVIMNVMIMMP